MTKQEIDLKVREAGQEARTAQAKICELDNCMVGGCLTRAQTEAEDQCWSELTRAKRQELYAALKDLDDGTGDLTIIIREAVGRDFDVTAKEIRDDLLDAT